MRHGDQETRRSGMTMSGVVQGIIAELNDEAELSKVTDSEKVVEAYKKAGRIVKDRFAQYGAYLDQVVSPKVEAALEEMKSRANQTRVFEGPLIEMYGFADGSARIVIETTQADLEKVSAQTLDDLARVTLLRRETQSRMNPVEAEGCGV